MSSKQEKLAAARKRLKEFQGKSKELEIAKQKAMSDVSESKILKDGFHSNKAVIGSDPHFSSSENPGIPPHRETQLIYSKTTGNNASQGETSAPLSKESNFSIFQPEYNNMNQNLENDHRDRTYEGQKSENSVKVDLIVPTGKNDPVSNSMPVNKSLAQLEKDQGDSCIGFHENVNASVTCTETKQFIEKDVMNGSPLNDTITSLQKELQSHAQTIAILVQQRNDAQIALSKTQSLLNKKSGEAEALGQQIANLTSSVSNLTQRLFEAEAVIKKLNLEKEENLHRWNESRSLIDNCQAQLSKKEEEFEEMKRKYKEKSNDCQQLLTSLQEAQAQLSFYQIQMQQYSNEGHSGLAVQLSELQSECVSLKKKVEELEKKLEIEKAEKEESSQKFHTYAQQCNSQLSSLNSQLKSLKIEKENLSKENIVLSRNLSELEKARAELENAPSKSSEAEIAELQDQVNVLSEENKRLNNDLKDREEERGRLKHEVEEKELELNKLFGAVKELSEENKRLASEMEIPKADERLLATMESDKIAAAKAVSQNLTLKKQVVELEQAFIKLSEEKLELTNQLAHERHVSAELQASLRNGEGKNHEDDQQRECLHGVKEVEPSVDDSNEIEELRNIVRQLQDDKMELTARLNAYESNKRSDMKKKEEDCSENGENCENTKLLLQQMKEKVRKTMNEIAVLDEEKEKLEHLVLQLQGETETIGEYITLYQKQRMLLRQRAQEKDSQLLQLSRDKEELKSKLSALDELVQRLIAERENANVSPGSKLPDLNSSLQIHEKTAGKIRALINEIGSTTLINNQSIVFEHCSCCSGRLITI